MAGLAKTGMEWLQDPLSWLFVASVVFVMLQRRRRRGRAPPLPPGPYALPVVGNMLMMDQLTHRGFAGLAKQYGGLLHLRLGKVHTFAVSTPEYAQQVLQAQDAAFSHRPATIATTYLTYDRADMVFARYGPFWRQMRKLCVVELLSSKQVKRMEGIRAKEVGDLVRSITASAGATVNISEMVAALSNDVISQAVFGGKFPQQEEYLRELDEVFRLLGGFCLVDLFPSSPLSRWLSNGEREMNKCHHRIHRIIANVIEERKASRAAHTGSSVAGHEDMLDVLLRLQEEASLAFPLTTDTIGAVLFVSTSACCSLDCTQHASGCVS